MGAFFGGGAFAAKHGEFVFHVGAACAVGIGRWGFEVSVGVEFDKVEFVVAFERFPQDAVTAVSRDTSGATKVVVGTVNNVVLPRVAARDVGALVGVGAGKKVDVWAAEYFFGGEVTTVLYPNIFEQVAVKSTDDDLVVCGLFGHLGKVAQCFGANVLVKAVEVGDGVVLFFWIA